MSFKDYVITLIEKIEDDKTASQVINKANVNAILEHLAKVTTTVQELKDKNNMTMLTSTLGRLNEIKRFLEQYKSVVELLAVKK